MKIQLWVYQLKKLPNKVMDTLSLARASKIVKKDGLPEVAQKIIDDLKFDFNVAYDEKDAVGRRYRRQDAAGTPFCITVDHDSLEDESVTIRDRDTMEQKRVKISELATILHEKIDFKHWAK